MTRDEASKSKIQIVYADSDTLSSFLNRNCFEYFMRVFEHIEAEIIIPKAVYREICRDPKGNMRKSAIDQMKRTARVKIDDIEICSEEDKTYSVLSKRMGAGEAADLAFAKHCKVKCCVASNNMSDVADYANNNNIELWPTSKIMREAVEANIISIGQADNIWKKMKEDGLKLPAYPTFEAFYEKAS